MEKTRNTNGTFIKGFLSKKPTRGVMGKFPQSRRAKNTKAKFKPANEEYGNTNGATIMGRPMNQ